MISAENIKKAEILVSLLKEKNLRVTFAESCTGGLLGATLTSVSGASEVFDGSVVSYANRIKEEKLGVKAETLEKFGAVSRQTAHEMAVGARKMFSADCCAAITGIAGPSGGSPEKPVGTVYIAASFGERIAVEHCLFDGDRDSVRSQSVGKALEMLICAVNSEQ